MWHASQYEFEDVVTEVDDAVLVTPPPRRMNAAGAMLHGIGNRAGMVVRRPRRAAMLPPGEAHDVDLFFAVFAAPHEIGALPHVRAQLRRSTAKVAFIVELWEPQLASVSDYLKELRGFDHIFLFNRAVIPAVREITGVACSYLPTAVDVLRFAPTAPWPERSIDVMSYGRRLPVTHEALRAAAADRALHYYYDTVRGAFEVTGHVEHREALAAALQRSRYVVVYKNNDEPARVARTGGEESLTNRYFEPLASGAVLLGTAAEVADFGDCFDWPDALIPIAAPAPDIADVIASLDLQPERMAEARRAAVVGSLRRHDWAHRWQAMLDAIGMDPHPLLGERLDRLAQREASVTSTGAL